MNALSSYASDGTEVFATNEEWIFEDENGNLYERCWRCGEIFPEGEMIIGNIDGIYCETCDEEMLLEGYYD